MDGPDDGQEPDLYRFNLDNFNAAENVGGIRAKSNGETNLTNVQAHAVSDTYIFGPTNEHRWIPVYRYANSLQPFSRTPEQQRPDLVIGLRTGILSQRSRSGMSFSTISAGRLGSRASSLERNIITYRVPLRSVLLQRVVPFLQRCSSWRHPSDLLVQTQCSTPDCLLAMLRAAWLASMYKRLQGNTEPDLNWVFAGLLHNETTITSMAGWEF